MEASRPSADNLRTRTANEAGGEIVDVHEFSSPTRTCTSPRWSDDHRFGPSPSPSRHRSPLVYGSKWPQPDGQPNALELDGYPYGALPHGPGRAVPARRRRGWDLAARNRSRRWPSASQQFGRRRASAGVDRRGNWPAFRLHRPATGRTGGMSGVSRRGLQEIRCSPGTRALGTKYRVMCPRRLTFASDGRQSGTPNGIRTRATAVKGRGPGPLDDGGQNADQHKGNPVPLRFRDGPDAPVWCASPARPGHGSAGVGQASVGTSVRLKIGRSAVRPRPWPPATAGDVSPDLRLLRSVDVTSAYAFPPNEIGRSAVRPRPWPSTESQIVCFLTWRFFNHGRHGRPAVLNRQGRQSHKVAGRCCTHVARISGHPKGPRHRSRTRPIAGSGPNPVQKREVTQQHQGLVEWELAFVLPVASSRGLPRSACPGASRRSRIVRPSRLTFAQAEKLPIARRRCPRSGVQHGVSTRGDV